MIQLVLPPATAAAAVPPVFHVLCANRHWRDGNVQEFCRQRLARQLVEMAREASLGEICIQQVRFVWW